jgi:hypothetical protein
LVSVGWAGLTVETEVVLDWTELALGRNEPDVEDSTANEVVFCATVVAVVVVAGAEVLELELLVEVEVTGAGVCETRPPSMPYSEAQVARSMPSGQHHVSPWVSAVQ